MKFPKTGTIDGYWIWIEGETWLLEQPQDDPRPQLREQLAEQREYISSSDLALFSRSETV